MEFYYHEIDNDVLVIVADGGIDRKTAAEFLDGIHELIAGGIKRIIVDCQHLGFISSYGLSVLLRLHKRARVEGGEVKLACVHSRVVAVLELLHLNRIFEVYPDVNRALLEFRPKDD